MPGKCIVIGSCILSLAIIAIVVVYIPLYVRVQQGYNKDNATLTLLTEVADGTYSPVICKLYRISGPPLWSFIQATSGEQDSRLNGLAVYSELADACQVLEDVGKVKVQMHTLMKINLQLMTWI